MYYVLWLYCVVSYFPFMPRYPGASTPQLQFLGTGPPIIHTEMADCMRLFPITVTGPVSLVREHFPGEIFAVGD